MPFYRYCPSRLVAITAGCLLLQGCSQLKDTASSAFDMSEYRQAVERQKNQQRVADEPDPPSPQMTAEEHEKAGDMEMTKHNYPMAGVHYNKVLIADPTRNTARLKLGQILLKQGLPEPALTQFQDARARDPQSAGAYQGIGHAYLMQGKFPEARQALEKAVALDDTQWVSYNLLGLAYDQDQRYEQAITSYKAALALHPRDPSILNNLGLAYALSGDHEAAIQAFEQAVATGSASAKVHNNLGVAYARRERYAEAFESFKKATDEPRAYNNLGMALLGMGNAKVAAACFEKAIELNPQYYEKASENLRQARQALGQSSNQTSSPPTETVSCP